MHLPQLSRNNDYYTAMHPIRCLKEFKDNVEIIVVTDNTNAKGPTIVRDVVNTASVNPLRGENCGAFGPRFPDMTRIMDRQMAERLQQKLKLGISVFYLSLDLRNNNQLIENVVYGGNMEVLLVMCHQGMSVVGVCTPDYREFAMIEQAWTEAKALAAIEETE